MPNKVKLIPLNKVVPFDENPRTILEFRDLGTIAERGLDTPIVVLPMPDGTFIIGKGHRRFAFIMHLMDTNPEAFKAHFSRGVLAEILPDNTSKEEFALIVADHGESRTLTNDYEHYLLCRLLTRAGLKRDVVIMKMASLLNAVKPFKKQELTLKINELMEIADDKSKPIMDRAKAEVELKEVTVKARTGLIQRYQAIASMPEKVEACWEYACTGKKRESYEDEYLPKKLTETWVKKLHSSTNGYLKDVENNEAATAPLFEARWAEFVEAAKAPKGETKRKARSRNEVMEVADKLESEAGKVLLQYAANESGVGVEKVHALEEDLLILDWLKIFKPEVYEAHKAEYREFAKDKAEKLSETEEAETE